MLVGDRAERGAVDAARRRPSRSGRPAAAARPGRAGCAATGGLRPGPAGPAPGRRRGRAGPRGQRPRRPPPRRGQRQHQHQPAVACIRPGPGSTQPTGDSHEQPPRLPPAPAAAPADMSSVCRGEHADRDRPGAAGAPGQLGRDRGDRRRTASPHVPIASPRAAEPPAGRPMAASPAEISSASTQLAAAASSTPDGQRGAPANRGRADQLEAARPPRRPGCAGSR